MLEATQRSLFIDIPSRHLANKKIRGFDAKGIECARFEFDSTGERAIFWWLGNPYPNSTISPFDQREKVMGHVSYWIAQGIRIEIG